MLLVMDKSTHEEHLCQPLQTNNMQFKITITFLTGYNGFLNFYIIELYYTTAIVVDDSSNMSLKSGAYGLESLDKEIKSMIIEEGSFTEVNYPFVIKPNPSTLGSIIEISPARRIQISSFHDDGISNLLGFKPTVMHKEYNL